MHVARKRFGQHFLHDKQIIDRLVNVIAPTASQHLVEIGPGQGALTVPVLKKTGTMDVVELDRDLIPILTGHCQDIGTLHIHQADALTFDFATLATDKLPLRIIGNLPYNISTPLIFHLLTFAHHIADMHFMLQKEVVDRLAAQPGCADYGRLSVMVQYQCAVTALFDVPPSAFHPPPKVDSRIVRIVPYNTLTQVAKDDAHFRNVVRQAFSQRRKTIRNCLKRMMTDDAWEKSNIDPKLRPEQLTVADYVKLSNDLIELENSRRNEDGMEQN